MNFCPIVTYYLKENNIYRDRDGYNNLNFNLNFLGKKNVIPAFVLAPKASKMFKPEVRNFVPSVSVVGDSFCFPYLVNLIVKKKTGFLSKHIDVLDGNGILLLQVDGDSWQFKKKRTMFDSLGLPLITLMRPKAISRRQQWIVHRGEGIDGNNLLFTVQKSQLFQLKTQLEVFLAINLKGEICDFRVIGSYISDSFKVYKGDTLIAEVKKIFKLGSIGKESFEARIYPGIDYAFVVSLLVIITETD